MLVALASPWHKLPGGKLYSIPESPQYIQLRVEAFEMAPESGFAEKLGRSALLESLGWRGALISASIPMTWRSQVKVDFEIFDAPTKQLIFSRSYSETRSVKVNG